MYTKNPIGDKSPLIQSILCYILFTLLFSPILFSCGNIEKKEIANLVKEWQGREIFFPEGSVFTIQGRDTVDFNFRNADYKIVTYVDTMGCSSCQLQLQLWKKYMERIDSVSNIRIPFVFYFTPEKPRRITDVTRGESFTYPICLDMDGEFNRLNHFPNRIQFHTFLIDRDNHVLASGNPILSSGVSDLYIDIITGESSVSSKALLTTAEADTLKFDFGEFNETEKQERIITFHNTGDSPLIIQDVVKSCGCTEVSYSHEPVMPGKNLKLSIVYDANQSGKFHKSLMVYCNTPDSPYRIEIEGNVRNM